MAGDTPALGALLGVVALLKEHFDVIDADFQRFYGLDLGDACWGEDHVGVRRLMALISGLPAESALARVRGDWWSEQHELLAGLVEMTHDVAHSARLSAQSGWGKDYNKVRLKEPLRVPRPGDEEKQPEERPPMSLREARATLLRS